MRIYYINNDEVNLAVANRMAARFGAIVCPVHPHDRLPDGRHDAVLYNLDDVPRYRQGNVLAEILCGPSARPMAVHGYGLSEDLAVSLRLHGVAVAQRLRPDLFRLLCRAILENQAGVPPDDALVEDTWTNLAK
jgi:hypothetical protein